MRISTRTLESRPFLLDSPAASLDADLVRPPIAPPVLQRTRAGRRQRRRRVREIGGYIANFHALFCRDRFRLRSDLFGDLVSRPLVLLVSILLPPPRPLPSRPLSAFRFARAAPTRLALSSSGPCLLLDTPISPRCECATLLPLLDCSDRLPDPGESGDIGDILQPSLLLAPSNFLRRHVLPPAAVLLPPAPRRRRQCAVALHQGPQLSPAWPGRRSLKRPWTRRTRSFDETRASSLGPWPSLGSCSAAFSAACSSAFA